MANKPDQLYFLLQQYIIDLSLIDRNHYLAKTDRRENNTEHSVSVALLCWYIHDKHNLPLDIGKILKYALAHDFVEIYVGDVNTFASPQERRQKIQKEADALKRLKEELRGFDNFIAILEAYESKSDEEALFVWTVDKMQALVMADLDNWRPYEEISITYKQFVDKHTKQLLESSAYAKAIFSELIEYCKGTFYDRPS